MKRSIFDVCLLLGVFLLPWWVVLVLCLLGIFLFNNFYESIVIFLLNYAVYGQANNGLFASNVYLPIILIIVFILMRAFKRQFIFDQR